MQSCLCLGAVMNCEKSRKNGGICLAMASFCNRYESVLDVGCGPYELMYVRNDEKTVGVDISNFILRILLNCGFQGHAGQADSQHLPFRNKSFDCLVSNQLIEHMTSLKAIKKVVNEMQRISGNIMIITPNSAFCRRIHDPTHFFFFTTRDLKKIMPSFEIYASNLLPTQTLNYYFLYDSPQLRKMPFIGALVFNMLRMIESSRFVSWLNKKLWVGIHLIAVKHDA